MVVIGVTGGVGTGKSTVSGMFGSLGASVLDADVCARALSAPGRAAWKEIVTAFGKGILRPDRSVDRAKLAALVFDDARARRRLERIIHPRVLRQLRGDLKRLRGIGRVPAVVLDVPLLFESGADGLADITIVVVARKAVQIKRLREKYGWTRAQIQKRMDAQWELSVKIGLADCIIDNSGSMATTRRQVRNLWHEHIKTTARN